MTSTNYFVIVLYLRNTNCPLCILIHPPLLCGEYVNAVVFVVVSLGENKRQALVERSLSSHVYFLENIKLYITVMNVSSNL